MRQHPTLQGAFVRSARDAMLIFNAVANRTLPKVERRLDENERSLIQSGNVYVWEERGAHIDSTGLSMERWTDGLHWGPSRAREFLYYHQIVDDDANTSSKRRRAVRNTPLTTAPVAGSSTSGRNVPLLTKQTFSVNVTLPHEQVHGLITRKWHMTAYFASEDIPRLSIIETHPAIGDAPIPEGVFASARASTRTGASTRRNSMPSRPNLVPAPPSMTASNSEVVARPTNLSYDAYSLPPTPIDGTPSPTAKPPLRPVHAEQPISRMGPIPPLPAAIPAPIHFPRQPEWDVYAPASAGGDYLSARRMSLAEAIAPAPSPSASQQLQQYQSVVLPPIRSPSQAKQSTPTLIPVPIPAKEIKRAMAPPPVPSKAYLNKLRVNSPMSSSSTSMCAIDKLLVQAADRPTPLAIATSSNGKYDAGFPEGPPHPEDRPELRLAPLAYLEGIAPASGRRLRRGIDDGAIRSFTGTAPGKWMNGGP